jgi:hypothetical protein
MPVKNADNNNISTPARTAKFCVLAHFADIDYRVRKKRRLLWLVHMISIFYIVISRKNRRQSRGSGRIKAFAQIHLPVGHVERITSTMAEAGTNKMITSILAHHCTLHIYYFDYLC